MDAVQQILDSACYVEKCHLTFESPFSHDENPNLEKMEGLRTLEISVLLDWREIEELAGQEQLNPLNDAMRTMDTAPPTVEHIILNVNIYNTDELSYFTQSVSFGTSGTAPPCGMLWFGLCPTSTLRTGCEISRQCFISSTKEG
ncbi:hypothetical protein B0H11DRAFT_1913018 [Mycena galericulata]|nr:hypothetical protein B0H11DRAFT_1913018 [Mycena galericulata]